MEASVILIFFFAALIRSGLGFGDALFAMPLLSMTLGLEFATPILAVDALLISLFLFLLERKKVSFKLLYPFLISAIIGVPIGIYSLVSLDEQLLKLILGSVIFLFSIYKVINPGKIFSFPRFSVFIFGLISGMLGGAYNTNGPPAILYAANNYPQEEFKANLQGMLFPVNIIIISGHFLSGLWSAKTFELFSISLIPITIGTLIGVFISSKIKSEIISKIVWLALVIISLNLILNSV